MIKKRIKLARPIKRRDRFSYRIRRSWNPFRWRIMFTVTWSEAAVFPKSAFQSGAYYFTDSSCMIYATPTKPAINFTGSGVSLDAAIKDLESKITARHSKTIDKQIDEQLAAFKTALG